jgi:hypothetical protein
MKTSSLIPLACALALLGGGCTPAGSAISARITEKATVFGKLPPEVQKDIREGTVEAGYTADMVYMALGKPTKVVVRDTPRGKVGIWEFRNFYPESYDAAPSETSAEAPPSTSAFAKVGSSNYGNLHAKTEPDVSYVALDRRGNNPGTPREGSFSGRSGAMDYVDIPEMDSATLYVIFFEGRVVQMKLGKR